MKDPNKKPKNTTDKKLTYNLPLKRNDAKTGADLAATRKFAMAVNASKGGAKGMIAKIQKQKTLQPSITVKNPDYKPPKKTRNPRNNQPSNSPVVGSGNTTPLDSKRQQKPKFANTRSIDVSDSFTDPNKA